MAEPYPFGRRLFWLVSRDDLGLRAQLQRFAPTLQYAVDAEDEASSPLTAPALAALVGGVVLYLLAAGGRSRSVAKPGSE